MTEILLTAFYAFLPLYVIGVPWWLIALLVIVAVVCKMLPRIFNYIMQTLLVIAWVWSFIIIIHGPLDALSIIYLIVAAFYVCTEHRPRIVRVFV